MKEFEHKDLIQLQVVRDKISEIFNLLRSEPGVSTGSDFHLVLFLLSAYRDNVFPHMLPSKSPKWTEDLRVSTQVLTGYQNHFYQILFDYYLPLLEKISPDGLNRLVLAIRDIDRSVLDNHFTAFFDELLERISKSEGKKGIQFFQPAEITNLMIQLAELPKFSAVFNPFAGVASFGVGLKDGQNYLGQELNQATWALGILRLNAFRVNSTYQCADSILQWPESVKKFDLVISNPPYGLKLGRQNDDQGFRSSEQFLIERGLASLTAQGKIVALLPQGWLFKNSKVESALRKRLIEEDLLDTLVALPGGLLSHTSIPLVVVVINKAKQNPGQVRMIKAAKFVSVTNRESRLNVYGLITLLNGNKRDSEVVRYINNAELRNEKYVISFPRHFQSIDEQIELEGKVKLKEILQPIKLGKRDQVDVGKIIRISDLKNDRHDYQLRANSLRESLLTNAITTKLSEHALLIALNWREIKPTWFQYEGESAFLNKDVFALRVDNSQVDVSYLVNELHASYVKNQLDAYRIGTVVSTIKKVDFLEVAINLPSLEAQKSKVEGLNELSSQLTALEKQRNELAHGLNGQLYERFSSIKHALGKPLLNIQSSLKNIETALSRHNTAWKDIVISERHGVAVSDAFSSIRNNLELIHDVLRKNDSLFDVSDYSLTELDFFSFINKFHKALKSGSSEMVSIDLVFHPDVKEVLKNKLPMMANARLLEIGLHAIVENAHKHAFLNPNLSNKIEIRVGIIDKATDLKVFNQSGAQSQPYVKVEVANTGAPFPENFGLDKLIRKNAFAGATGNTGQGGFELNEIIKRHNEGMSTLSVITDDPASEFVTTYSFLLPITR